MAKRIFLFILTNLLVITTIGIVLTIITSVTGVGSYIQNGRIDLMALLVFSLVVGFVGSFISLGMSRWMAKTMMGVRVLNPKKQSLSYEALAVAVIDDELALTASANIRFTRQVKEGERVVAKAKVTAVEKEKGRTVVEVNSYVGEEVVFSGSFDMYRSKQS